MTRIRDAVEAVAEAIIKEKDYLNDLDAAICDGDHGINMARGLAAVMEAVDDMDDTTQPAPVLDMIGHTLLSTVGGAAGPLYGNAFLAASKACTENTRLNITSIANVMAYAIAAIEKRGRSQRGEKTMLDVLIPIQECFLPENSQDKTLFTCLGEAAKAATDGLEYTKTIIATKGRASYVGERSIGHADPGAASSSIMFHALYAFLKR